MLYVGLLLHDRILYTGTYFYTVLHCTLTWTGFPSGRRVAKRAADSVAAGDGWCLHHGCGAAGALHGE